MENSLHLLKHFAQIRNKPSINEKHRKIYHKYKTAIPSCGEETSAVPTTQQSTTDRDIGVFLEHAERICRQMNRITMGNPVEFVEQACLAFLASDDREIIHDYVVQLGKCQKSIYKYQNKIYKLGGISPEYHTVEKMVKDICRVVGWIEEVFCFAMVDIADVRHMYQGREFQYQKNSD